MVRGRDGRGSSHPGTVTLRPRREVASSANLGQHSRLPAGREEGQPERPVLDSIGAPMSGWISIESGENAQRVIESSFPPTRFHEYIDGFC